MATDVVMTVSHLKLDHDSPEDLGRLLLKRWCDTYQSPYDQPPTAETGRYIAKMCGNIEGVAHLTAVSIKEKGGPRKWMLDSSTFYQVAGPRD
jgi:hypothetical protein